MFKRSSLWRGLTLVFSLLLAISLMAGSILETYRTSVDAFFNTRSQLTVTEVDETGEAWSYVSKFKTAKEAFEGLKEFAIRESQETVALLKNDGNALPLSKDAKITMLGVRSYAPVYGSSGGSITDGNATVQIFDCFTERGFQLNPSVQAAYAKYFADKTWTKPRFGGGIIPEYAEITAYNDPNELTLDELTALNADFRKDYAEYSDAAIVVVGRPGSEAGNGYYPGKDGLAEGVSTVTGNILSLSDEEMAMINEAKANFDKVIVLVNATNPMEIANLKDDPDIDAIVVVCLKEYIDVLEQLITKFGVGKIAAIVPGGSSGQESIRNGVDKANRLYPADSVVIVHDGVRPLIDQQTITDCIVSVKKNGSAVTVVPATETIVQSEDGVITNIIDRKQCQLARAPQCFRLGELHDAHHKAVEEGLGDFIDSASLMSYYGHKLYEVEGANSNIKITTPSDFYIMRAIMDAEESSQIFGL